MPPDFSELSKLFISKILKFKDERASLSLLKDDIWFKCKFIYY